MKLYAVGIGPGGMEDMTHRAWAVLQSVDIIIGYKTYTDLIQPLLPEKTFIASSMRQEIQRCRLALEEAKKHSVAVISSGDSGIYGMAGLLYSLAAQAPEPIQVEIIPIPGVTAASAAAALLGAPLMHDFAVISLSDCLTPWAVIERRLCMAAQADFVICLYNPCSRHRPHTLTAAAALIQQSRSEDTPAGIVRSAGRADEQVTLTTLGRLPEADVDMHCTVIIGNSQSYLLGDRMITPRGYREAEAACQENAASV